MSSPSPTPSPTPVDIAIDFFWNHGIGQAILLLVAGFLFRRVIWRGIRWIGSRLWAIANRVKDFVNDTRWTLWSTTDGEVERAVTETEIRMQKLIDQAHTEGSAALATALEEGETAVAKAQADGEAALEEVRRRLAPKKASKDDPDELQVRKELAQHEADTKRQWLITTDRSTEMAYTLENYAARQARNVRLISGKSGFEIIDGPPWAIIDQGDSVSFVGRISDPKWAYYGRQLTVRWTDDHGDERGYAIQVDRDPVDDWLLGF